MYLRDHPKPAKHVSFDYSSTSPSLAISCCDGIIYVYSLVDDRPELVKKIDGLIRALETEDESSSKVMWHPDGRAFATATATRGTECLSSDRHTSAEVDSQIYKSCQRETGSDRGLSKMATPAISVPYLGRQTARS